MTVIFKTAPEFVLCACRGMSSARIAEHGIPIMIPNSKWLSKGSANAAFQTLFSDELMRILKRPIETLNHLKTALALAGAAPTDS
jgi:hypothetical protein